MHTAEDLSRWLSGVCFLTGNSARTDMRRLVKLNAALEKDARLGSFNETLLEKRLNGLEGIRAVRGVAYGLTLARINELALLLAGNYADHCVTQGVGDLLFNPRRILVHIRGLSDPVVKKRHLGLTEQFADAAETRGDVVAWLRDETVLEIKEKALLPHLYERLRDSGVVSPQYLDSVRTRTGRIADLTGFLASGSFSPGLDFHQWLQHAGAAERKLVASKICRFDTKIFLELGNDFQQILRMKDIQPSFLGKMEMAPSIG